MNTMLVAQAWFDFLYMDLIWFRGFKAIRRLVRPRLTPPSATPAATVHEVMQAVTVARVLYVKPVWCLQNSAVVTRLLRRRGVDADLVIGAHLMPIRAHAWVEVAGKVITEREEDQECFCILDKW
jgi:hypothetical protein